VKLGEVEVISVLVTRAMHGDISYHKVGGDMFRELTLTMAKQIVQVEAMDPGASEDVGTLKLKKGKGQKGSMRKDGKGQESRGGRGHVDSRFSPVCGMEN